MAQEGGRVLNWLQGFKSLDTYMQEKLLGLEPLSYALKQEAGDTLEQTHPWKWSYGVEVLLLW